MRAKDASDLLRTVGAEFARFGAARAPPPRLNRRARSHFAFPFGEVGKGRTTLNLIAGLGRRRSCDRRTGPQLHRKTQQFSLVQIREFGGARSSSTDRGRTGAWLHNR